MLWSDLERLSGFFDPWRDVDRMGRALRRVDSQSAVEFPALNVWISGDHAVVTTEVPGIDPKDLEITALRDTLTLRGMRKPEALGEGETYHRRERWSGQFSKTLQLPFSVDAGRVEARFTKGVLYIALPRIEADKPKKVSVTSE